MLRKSGKLNAPLLNVNNDIDDKDLNIEINVEKNLLCFNMEPVSISNINDNKNNETVILDNPIEEIFENEESFPVLEPFKINKVNNGEELTSFSEINSEKEESQHEQLLNNKNIVLDNVIQPSLETSENINGKIDFIKESDLKLITNDNIIQDNSLKYDKTVKVFVHSIYLDTLKNAQPGYFKTDVTNSLPSCTPSINESVRSNKSQNCKCKKRYKNKPCSLCREISSKRFFRENYNPNLLDSPQDIHLNSLFNQYEELEECRIRRKYLKKLLAITLCSELRFSTFYLIFLLMSLSIIFDRKNEIIDICKGLDHLFFGQFEKNPELNSCSEKTSELLNILNNNKNKIRENNSSLNNKSDPEKWKSRKLITKKVKKSIRAVKLKMKDFSPLCIPTLINGTELNLEIDCGAAVSCLSQSLLKKACPDYESKYKNIKARELYDVQNNLIKLEDDRIIPLNILGYGIIHFRFSILKEDHVFIMGRDLMAKTQLSLCYRNAAYYEAVFRSKNRKLRIFKNTIINSKIIKERDRHSVDWSEKSLFKHHSCPENKHIINKIITKKINKPSLNQLKRLSNLKKLEKTSSIKLLFQKSNMIEDFNQFLKVCSKIVLDLNFSQFLRSLNNCIYYNENSLLSSEYELVLPLFEGVEFLSKDLALYIQDKLELNKYEAPNIIFLHVMFKRMKSFGKFYKFIVHHTFDELIYLVYQLHLLKIDENSSNSSLFKPILNSVDKIKINKIENVNLNNINNDNTASDSIEDEHILLDAEYKDKINSEYGLDLESLLSPMNKSLEEVTTELKIDSETHRENLAKFIFDLSCSASHELDVGKLHGDIQPMKLELIPGKSIPRNTRYYKLNNVDSEHLQNFFAFLCHHKLAKPSSLGFGSPCFLIGRKERDRLPRIIFDVRAMNSVIRNDCAATLPEPLTVLKNIVSDVKYVSVIDLKNCFYSLPVDQSTLDAGFNNICTSFGCFEISRAVTGFNYVPAYLANILNHYLHIDKDGKYDMLSFCINFFDDLIIFSKRSDTIEDHLNKVKTVLSRLSKIGFKIGLHKCRFLIDTDKDDVEILGYSLYNSKIRIPPKRLEALKRVKEPSTLKELQSFCGSLNYYRSLLDLQSLNSLNQLYKLTSDFKSCPSLTFHFKRIMGFLFKRSQYIMGPYKQSISIVLSDASSSGIGACLISYDVSDLVENININTDNIEKQENKIVSYFRSKNIEVESMSENINPIKCILDGLIKLEYSFITKTVKEFVIMILTRGGLVIDFNNFIPEQDLGSFIKSLVNNKVWEKNDIFECPITYSFICLVISRMVSRKIVLVLHHPHNDDLVEQSFGNFSDTIYIYLNDNTKRYHSLCIKNGSEKYPKTNVHFSDHMKSDLEVKTAFYKTLKNGKHSDILKKVRIISYFSKVIEKDFMKRNPVCFLESYAVFQALSYFEKDLVSPYVYVLCDSEVAISCLQNNKVSSRTNKLNTLSQKIHHYFGNRNLHFIAIKSNMNYSDYISRLLPELSSRLDFKDPKPEFTCNDFDILSDQSHKTEKNKAVLNIKMISNKLIENENKLIQRTYNKYGHSFIVNKNNLNETVPLYSELIKENELCVREMDITENVNAKLPNHKLFFNMLENNKSAKDIMENGSLPLCNDVKLQQEGIVLNKIQKIKIQNFDSKNEKFIQFESNNKIYKVKDPEIQTRPFTAGFKAREFDKIMSKSNFILFQLQEKKCDNYNPTSLKYYNNKILLPEKLYFLFSCIYHSLLNHTGKDNLYKYITSYFYVDKKMVLKGIVESLCLNCLPCLIGKPVIHNYKQASFDTRKLTQPNTLAICDLLEFPTTIMGGYHHVSALFVIVDAYSKFVQGHVLRAKTQENIIHVLTNFFQSCGGYDQIYSDNATCFKGNKIMQFFKDNKVQVIPASANVSKARGIIERKIRSFQEMIRYNNVDKTDLNICNTLIACSFALNSIPFKNSLLTPYNVHYSSVRNFKTENDEENNSMFNSGNFLPKNISKENFGKLQSFIIKNEKEHKMNEKDEKMKKWRKINEHKRFHKYKIGDLCFIRDYDRLKQRPLFFLTLHRVVRVNKYSLWIENLYEKQVIIREPHQLKKFDKEKIIKTDLPTELMRDLKVITTTTVNDLLQFPLLKIENRKSLRIPKNKLIGRRKSQRNLIGEDIILEDNEHEEEEPKSIDLFDSLSLLSTIFEEEEP